MAGELQKLSELAQRVRETTQDRDDDQADRDELLFQLNGRGITLQTLADTAQLSTAYVHRIVLKLAARTNAAAAPDQGPGAAAEG